MHFSVFALIFVSISLVSFHYAFASDLGSDMGSWPTKFFPLPVVNVDCTKGLGGDSAGDGICSNWKVSDTTKTLYGLDIKFFNHTSTNPPVYNGTKNSDGVLFEYFMPCGGPGFSDPLVFLPGATGDRGDQCPVPSHKDIYVEYDAMYGHSLTTTAYNDLINNFAIIPNSLLSPSNPNGGPGITLHLQWGGDGNNFGNYGESNFHRDYLSVVAPSNQQGFLNLKNAWFGTPFERSVNIDGSAHDTTNCPGGESVTNCLVAKSQIFHHTMMINKQLENPTYSGWSWTPGNNFIISLGSFANGVGSDDQQEGTFMHELGHNLGLHHGGIDDLNGKPNYFSVMSAAFQFRSTFDLCRPLNYSGAALSTLDESNLNENAGVDKYNYPSNNALNQPPSGSISACNNVGGTPRYTFWSVPGTIHAAPSGTAIDWNNNGIVETSVPAEINNIAGWGVPDSSTDKLMGYNDWNRLIYNFRGASGFIPFLPPTGNLTGMNVTSSQLPHRDFTSDDLLDSLAYHLIAITDSLRKPSSDAFTNGEDGRNMLVSNVTSAIVYNENNDYAGAIHILQQMKDKINNQGESPIKNSSTKTEVLTRIDNAVDRFQIVSSTSPIFNPVKCGHAFVPIIKNDGSQACVKETSIQKLVDRNWARWQPVLPHYEAMH